MPVEALAGCRELVSATLALERFQAEGIFEPRDLARHCRGCDIEAAASLPDREISGNRAELDERRLMKDARQQGRREGALTRTRCICRLAAVRGTVSIEIIGDLILVRVVRRH
jgi:hypothetical protein